MHSILVPRKVVGLGTRPYTRLLPCVCTVVQSNNHYCPTHCVPTTRPYTRLLPLWSKAITITVPPTASPPPDPIHAYFLVWSKAITITVPPTASPPPDPIHVYFLVYAQYHKHVNNSEISHDMTLMMERRLTVWRQISEELNFRGFCELDCNCRIYAREIDRIPIRIFSKIGG